MKTIYYIGFLIVIASLSSCKKYLDLKPISVASTANFYKSATDINTAIIGAYADLQSTQLYKANFVTMMEVRSDNVEDNNPGGSAGINYNIDQFTAKSDNGVIRASWAEQYNQIYRLNNVLNYLNVVTDVQQRKQFEGEAKFLRALGYFNIVRLWGNAPLVLEPITNDDAYQLKRNDKQDIYNALEADLLDASANLPKTYTGANIGRASSGAAKTLLAKLYLEKKDYSKVVATLDDIISNYGSVYQLLPNVSDVFSVNNKMNKEIIFAVRYAKNIPGETNSVPDAYGKFNLDKNLLNAYQSSDTRKDLLTLTLINAKYVVKKYADVPDATTGGVGFDFPVIRYADVLLMYAESLNEIAYSSDINGKAFAALNAIRSRAKASLYTAADLQNQAAFRTAVLNERRLELPLENQRWFDLVRTNTAIQAMAAVGLTITTKDYLYPIPQTEVDIMNNPIAFPQNPGY